ncbi:MAG: hypothetical protein NWP78_02470, partial [Ilumatobacteraceae bacterium]|nr:hypothetical protein [Ilumatobacteraceae bacterium]
MRHPRISGGDSPDTVRQYLNEIGQVPLLTSADEKVLGKAVKDGQAAKLRLEAGKGKLTAADR